LLFVVIGLLDRITKHTVCIFADFRFHSEQNLNLSTMMKSNKICTLLFLLVAQGFAFSPAVTRLSTPAWSEKTVLFSESFDDAEDGSPLIKMLESEKRGFLASRVVSKVAGLMSGLVGYVARGMAEDVEYAELPPPYVPALFGVVLLAGVGVLTASLGDVMTEGSSRLKILNGVRRSHLG
jgi:hypothetical protein